MEPTTDYIELNSFYTYKERHTDRLEQIKRQIQDYLEDVKTLHIRAECVAVCEGSNKLYICSAGEVYLYSLSADVLEKLPIQVDPSSKISVSYKCSALIYRLNNQIKKFNLDTYQDEGILYQGEISDFHILDSDIYIQNDRSILIYSITSPQIRSYDLNSCILNFCIDESHSYLYIQTHKILQKLSLSENTVIWSIDIDSYRGYLQVIGSFILRSYDNMCWIYDKAGVFKTVLVVDGPICSIQHINRERDLSIFTSNGLVYMYDLHKFELQFRVQVTKERVIDVVTDSEHVIIVTEENVKILNMQAEYKQLANVPEGDIQKVWIGYCDVFLISTSKQTFLYRQHEQLGNSVDIQGKVLEITEGNCILSVNKNKELLWNAVEVSKIKLEGDIELALKNNLGTKVFLFDSLCYLLEIDCRNKSLRSKKKLDRRFDCMALSNDEKRVVGIHSLNYIVILEVYELKTIHEIPIDFSVKVACWNDNLLILGGYNGTVTIFNIANLVVIGTIQAHESAITSLISYSYYLITSSYDRSIHIYNLNSYSCISHLDLPCSTTNLLISPDYSTLYILTSSDFYSLSNPLQSTHIQPFPDYYSYFYLIYCKNILQSSQEYYRFFNRFTLFPYEVNTYNLMVYSQNEKGMIRCKEEHVNYIGDGELSPLRMCERLKRYDQLGDVVRFLVDQNKKQPKVMKEVEDMLTEMKERNEESVEVYERILIEIDRREEEQLDVSLAEEKQLHSMRNTDHSSCINLNLAFGSSSSCIILQSILSSSHSFSSKLLKSLLLPKLYIVTPIYLSLSLLYFLNAAVLTQSILFSSHIFYTILLFFTNTLFLIHAILKLSSIFTYKYFNSYWLIDLLQIVLEYLYLLKTVDLQNDLDAVICAALVGSVWIQCLHSLRVFEGIRKSVDMSVKIVEDIIPIFFIGAVITFTFSFVFYILGDTEEVKLIDCFLHVLKMNLGDFDTDTYTDLQWVFFPISSMITPILLINLLIAFMTHSYTLNNTVDSDLYSQLLMIYELEITTFWRRNNTFRTCIRLRGS